MSKRIVNTGRRSLCGWSEIWDETKGKYYYFDPTSKKTSWQHPKNMNPPILPEGGDETQQNVPSTQQVNNEPVQQQENVETRKSDETSSNDDKKPVKIKFGFVTKQGEVRKNWTLRYFILYDDGELEYYKDAGKPKNPNDYADMRKASFKGAINIQTCRFRVSKGIRKGDLVLEVELKDRFFYMSFETKDELLEWKESFEEAGCEFYDMIVPQQKSFYERKLQEVNKQKNVIKRGENVRGRAIDELGIKRGTGSFFNFGRTGGSFIGGTGTTTSTTPGSPKLLPQSSFSFLGTQNIEKGGALYLEIVEFCKISAQFKIMISCMAYGTFVEAMVEGATQEHVQGFICHSVFKDQVNVTKKNHDFASVGLRQAAFFSRDICVFYPGGIETATDLMTAWMNVRSGLSKCKIVAFAFWKPFIEDVKKNLVMDAQEDSGFVYVETVADLKQFINQ
jgi:hypothetical protein